MPSVAPVFGGLRFAVLRFTRACALCAPQLPTTQGEPPVSEVLYSSSRAAKLAGVSEASLRNYAPGGKFGRHYADLYSATAAPPPGQPRQFSEQDVILLRFIRSRSQNGIPHARIAEEVRAGALDSFDWRPPDETAQHARAERAQGEEESQPPAALVAVQEVARQLAGVMAAQLEQARADNDALQTQIIEAEKRAAAAEKEAEMLRIDAEKLRAELADLRAERRKGVLARLFGRG